MNRYYEKNRERILQQQRTKYHQNAEERREYQRRWRVRNPEAVKRYRGKVNEITAEKNKLSALARYYKKKLDELSPNDRKYIYYFGKYNFLNEQIKLINEHHGKVCNNTTAAAIQ